MGWKVAILEKYHGCTEPIAGGSVSDDFFALSFQLRTHCLHLYWSAAVTAGWCKSCQKTTPSFSAIAPSKSVNSPPLFQYIFMEITTIFYKTTKFVQKITVRFHLNICLTCSWPDLRLANALQWIIRCNNKIQSIPYLADSFQQEHVWLQFCWKVNSMLVRHSLDLRIGIGLMLWSWWLHQRESYQSSLNNISESVTAKHRQCSAWSGKKGHCKQNMFHQNMFHHIIEEEGWWLFFLPLQLLFRMNKNKHIYIWLPLFSLYLFSMPDQN